MRLAALWAAFGLVHAALTWLGVVVVPAEAFWDLDLYRWWMAVGVADGLWPVLDQPWVYPAGALAPLALPALVTTTSTPGYALAWCVMVTALDAAALALLLRLPRGERAGWWWTAFLAALGPVAIGRLDAVVAPLVLGALALVVRDPGRTRWAAALLTAGAWVKVAPGALLLPLVAAARRGWRDVVLPAAGVSAVVVALVAVGGGAANLASFLSTQGGRGLQVESVAATPWVLRSLVDPAVRLVLDQELVTYQVQGQGAATAAALLDGVLLLAVAGVGALLLRARARGRAAEALLPGALALVAALVVANKVGSPQFVTWFAGPVAVLLATAPAHGVAGAGGLGGEALGGGGLGGGTVGGQVRTSPALRLPRVAATGTLVAAGLTQVVFPWGYLPFLEGDVGVTITLATRNLWLVALLAAAVAALWAVGSRRHREGV